MLLDFVPMASALDLGSLVNRDHPLVRRGLKVWYLALPQLDAGGTRWASLVSAGVPATLTNMAAPPTSTSGWGRSTLRRGGLGEVRYDGTNDWVDAGVQAPLQFVNTRFTVSCWFRSATSGVTQYLLCHRLTTNEGWHVRILGTNVVEVRTNNASALTAAVSSVATVTDGLWHQVVGVVTTDTTTAANNVVTGYLDSASFGSGTGSAVYAAPTGAHLALGSYSDGTQPLSGALDSVLIWSQALSAQEVRMLYQEERLGYPGMLTRLPLLPNVQQSLARGSRLTVLSQAMERGAFY